MQGHCLKGGQSILTLTGEERSISIRGDTQTVM